MNTEPRKYPFCFYHMGIPRAVYVTPYYTTENAPTEDEVGRPNYFLEKINTSPELLNESECSDLYIYCAQCFDEVSWKEANTHMTEQILRRELNA